MREHLIRVSDIPQDGTVTADVFGREVLVMLVNGKPRAFVSVCMHHGGSLIVDDDTLRCAWHGSTFDVWTSRVLSGPVRLGARLMTDARRGRRADVRVRRVTRRELHHGTDREHTEPGRVLAARTSRTRSIRRRSSSRRSAPPPCGAYASVGARDASSQVGI